MNPFQTAYFLVITLPAIMLKEGYDLLYAYLKKHGNESKMPYIIAMAVCILLIIILLVFAL